MQAENINNKVALLNNGTTMPRVGYGTFDGSDKLDTLIYEAIKLGYRHIDTAAAYRNEELVGKVLVCP